LRLGFYTTFPSFAVNEIIAFTVSRGCSALESAASVKVLEQITFMRLIPTDVVGGHGSEIEPIDIGRGDQFLNQHSVVRDRGHYQTWSQRFGNLVLIRLDDAGKGKKKLSICERMRCGLAKNDRRQQV